MEILHPLEKMIQIGDDVASITEIITAKKVIINIQGVRACYLPLYLFPAIFFQ